MSEVAFEVQQEALAVVRSTVINANFDEVKAALTEMVEPYRNLIVTEDGIAAAKNDRARIRKVASRVDELRKEVKKVYSEPLAVFEAKCKELVSICNEGSNNLDEQIKAFEETEKAQKIDALRAEYEAVADDEIREYLPWGYVNNPKWANKGYKSEDAVAEIQAAVAATRSDLEAIRTMGGDDTAYLLDVYRQTRDLSAVIRKQAELTAMREREEQRRRETEMRKAQMEKARAEAAAAKPKMEPEPETVYEPAVTVDIGESEMVTVTFCVTCSKAQLKALGAYMRENGISYRRA